MDPSAHPAEANEALLFRVARDLGGRSVEEWSHILTAHELVLWAQYDQALETARQMLNRRGDFVSRIESQR